MYEPLLPSMSCNGIVIGLTSRWRKWVGGVLGFSMGDPYAANSDISNHTEVEHVWRVNAIEGRHAVEREMRAASRVNVPTDAC